MEHSACEASFNQTGSTSIIINKKLTNVETREEWIVIIHPIIDNNFLHLQSSTLSPPSLSVLYTNRPFSLLSTLFTSVLALCPNQERVPKKSPFFRSYIFVMTETPSCILPPSSSVDMTRDMTSSSPRDRGGGRTSLWKRCRGRRWARSSLIFIPSLFPLSKLASAPLIVEIPGASFATYARVLHLLERRRRLRCAHFRN